MQVLCIVQLLLLLSWSSPTIGQCGNEDWTSTFAIAGDSTSQCTSSVSYVNGLRSEGYGALLETGPGVVKAAKCCSVDQPYSQESNDCYQAQWWTDLQRYVRVLTFLMINSSFKQRHGHNRIEKIIVFLYSQTQRNSRQLDRRLSWCETIHNTAFLSIYMPTFFEEIIG